MGALTTVVQRAEDGATRVNQATADAVTYLRRQTGALLRAAAEYVSPDGIRAKPTQRHG